MRNEQLRRHDQWLYLNEINVAEGGKQNKQSLRVRMKNSKDPVKDQLPLSNDLFGYYCSLNF